MTFSWDTDGPLNTKTNEGILLYTNVPCIYLKPFQTLTSTCHSGATRLASRQLSISCAWMPRWWMRHGLRHRCASDPHRQRKLLRVWSSPHRLWWALNQKLVSKSTIVLYTELNDCEDILYPITTTGNLRHVMGFRVTYYRFQPKSSQCEFWIKFYSIICSGGLGPGLGKADGKFEASSP